MFLTKAREEKEGSLLMCADLRPFAIKGKVRKASKFSPFMNHPNLKFCEETQIIYNSAHLTIHPRRSYFRCSQSNTIWSTVDATFHFDVTLYHFLFFLGDFATAQTTRRSVIKLQKRMPKVWHFSINLLRLPRSLVTLATINLKMGKVCKTQMCFRTN